MTRLKNGYRAIAPRGDTMTATPQKRALPAYLEYASDILANTQYRLMSISEKGLWDLMRKECWVNHSLPSDPTSLSKILNIPSQELQTLLTDRVLHFFATEDGLLFSPELENYRTSALHRRELQAKGGSKGGLKTQKSIRDDKGNLEGELKVLKREEMQREEETRRESSVKDQAQDEENTEWLEEYDKG